MLHVVRRGARQMVDLRPQYLWAGERYWPEQPYGLTFIVPAFERCAKIKFGSDWKEGQVLTDLYADLPAAIKNATPENRSYANWILSRFDGYEAEMEPNPVGTTTPAAPRSAAPGTLAMLGQTTAALAEPDQVYVFTERQWDAARNFIHCENVLLGKRIAQANEIARWFMNGIVASRLRAVAIRLDDAEIVECEPNSWLATDIRRITERIRKCRMSPRPPYKDGGYLIYLRTAELEAALSDLEVSGAASACNDATVIANTPASPPPKETEQDAEDKNAYWRQHKQAIMEFAIARIKELKLATRRDLLGDEITQKWNITANRYRTKVWRKATQEAGFPELSRPGNRDGSKRDQSRGE
jgi:hypothetical protein